MERAREAGKKKGEGWSGKRERLGEEERLSWEEGKPGMELAGMGLRGRDFHLAFVLV